MTSGMKLDSAARSKLRAMLLTRRAELLDNVTRLENGTLKSPRKDATGDLSAVPYHMADVASDNYEEEFALGIIQNGDEELREINAAIVRLDAGKFGTCEACGKHISKKRLLAIPYAKTCIECKRKEELALKSPPPVPET
jgi:DnaK suppressor protein